MFCRALASSPGTLAPAWELKPPEAPEQLSTSPVAATVLREAVGLTLLALVATAQPENSERELRSSSGPAPYSQAASRHLPAARLGDLLEPTAPAQEAPYPMKPRLQDSPRRRCRTANRQLRARALADKSALVRWWP